MLFDANLTPKLWPYAGHYAVLMYNNVPHPALDNQQSPNDGYGDASDFSKLYVFASICYALQASKLLHKLEERSPKGLFLGIDPAEYKVLDLQSKVAYVARTVKVFDGKFLSTEENQIHGLCREEEPTHSSSLHPTPARLEDSRESPQGSRERRSTADLTYARMLQLQELGLAATVTNTLDNQGEPQGFAEASKSEAWMESMREEHFSLIHNQTWTPVDLPPGRKAIRCGWIYKAKNNEHGAVYRLKSRLVAKGHSQKPGLDYNVTFAPVKDKVIRRSILSFAMHLVYELFQLNIDTAYLYWNLNKPFT